MNHKLCEALAELQTKYADLFDASVGSMRSFFAQPDHMKVFHYV